MLGVNDSNKKLLAGHRFIDLFSGIGGFRFALESFGGECAFSSDIDADARHTYFVNFGEKPAGDITKIAATEIPAHDILCAGFPCQPFSLSGRRLGFADTRGTLFHEIVRIAEHHQPKMLFLENVKNLCVHNSGGTLATIVKAIEKIGYDVTWRVLDSGNFDSPQKRERTYILGFHKDFGVKYVWPHKGDNTKCVADILEPPDCSYVKKMHIDVKTYPPTIDTGIVVPHGFLRPRQIGYVGKGRQGERIYHPNGKAVTISASGGGIGAKTGLYYINGIVRKLTPRECARLNGFPESFIPHHNHNAALKQLGNSVVVDVLQHIIANTAVSRAVCV